MRSSMIKMSFACVMASLLAGNIAKADSQPPRSTQVTTEPVVIIDYQPSPIDKDVLKAADMSNDGLVGMDDLLMLISHWGACPVWSELDCMGDINFDGYVDIGDLMMLLRLWNEPSNNSQPE